eukprot:gene1074-253_t
MSIKLNEILQEISDKCGVPLKDVKEAALGVTVAADGGYPLMRSQSSGTFKHPCVPLPETVNVQGGQKEEVSNMTIQELKDVLAKSDSRELAWPFLLRCVLGEFHYGQRVTAIQPGQKPAISPAGSPGHARQRGETDPLVAQNLRAFDVMAAESKYRHLHQVAGWVDITNKNVWDDYVKDTINGKIKEGDSVFEAGCGVMAFLTSCTEAWPNLTIGGLDGAPKTIQLNKERVADHLKNNFFVGMLPDAMADRSMLPDNSWDVVVCNSVFQYLPSEEAAQATVREMIRVARKWVIIADILDPRYQSQNHEFQKKGEMGEWAKDLPVYRDYDKNFWFQFENENTLLNMRHVESFDYVRRKQRYVVMFEVNAEVNSRPPTPEQRDSNQ